MFNGEFLLNFSFHEIFFQSWPRCLDAA